MSKFLIFAGLLLVGLGLILHFKVDIPWLTSWIGTLPGDLIIRKKDVTIYLPITTSLVISFVFSLVLSLLFKSSK